MALGVVRAGRERGLRVPRAPSTRTSPSPTRLLEASWLAEPWQPPSPSWQAPPSPSRFPQPTAQAAPPGGKDVTAVLFEWKFDSIAKACADSLGPAGYGYVQVSPPQEHIQGGQWWASYQPVSYRIAGRLGDRAAFSNMISACHSAGVKVVADSRHQPHGGRATAPARAAPRTPSTTYPGIYSGADLDDCRSSDQQLQRPCQRPELRTRRPRRPGHRRGLRTRPDRGVPRRPALPRRRRLPDRRGQAHAGRRPRQHQEQAEQSGRLLEAGGHLRRGRGRVAEPSTSAPATYRSSATPGASSRSSTTRTSPT